MEQVRLQLELVWLVEEEQEPRQEEDREEPRQEEDQEELQPHQDQREQCHRLVLSHLIFLEWSF